MDEASYTGISRGVRGSGSGGDSRGGCAGEDATACSVKLVKCYNLEGRWTHGLKLSDRCHAASRGL